MNSGPPVDGKKTEPAALIASDVIRKTIVNLDLKNYTGVARSLQEQLDAEVVGRFDDQIQTLIDAGLRVAGAERSRTVLRNTGDGAILGFARRRPHIASLPASTGRGTNTTPAWS